MSILDKSYEPVCIMGSGTISIFSVAVSTTAVVLEIASGEFSIEDAFNLEDFNGEDASLAEFSLRGEFSIGEKQKTFVSWVKNKE